MNELIQITSQIQNCRRTDVAKQIMTVCRAVTPQFYKNSSLDEVKAERHSIELLVANIDNETLAKMCELAVVNYPKARSENTQVYFDINYILQFYKQAFNYVHCDGIELSKTAEMLTSEYDTSTGILTEMWLDNGFEVCIKCFVEDTGGRAYSPKAYGKLFTDLDKIEI